MEKEYYTKAEVDQLLVNQKEEIFEALKIKGDFHFETFKLNTEDPQHTPGFINKFELLMLLKKNLTEAKLIENVTDNIFIKAFSGYEILEAESPLIKWIGQKTLCPYFIFMLVDHSYLYDKDHSAGKKMDKMAHKIFGIKNAAELKYKHKGYNDSLPTDHKKIDDIIYALNDFRIKLGEDEIYFNKEILPFISEEDSLDSPDDYFNSPDPRDH